MSWLKFSAVARFHSSRLTGLSWNERFGYLWRRAGVRLAPLSKEISSSANQPNPSEGLSSSSQEALIEVAKTDYDLKVKSSLSYRTFLFKRFNGSLTLFRIAHPHLAQPDPIGYGWGRLVIGSVDIEIVPGDHDSMVAEPHLRALAEKITSAIGKRMAV
jgi:thioesterase domain-containing protein